MHNIVPKTNLICVKKSRFKEFEESLEMKGLEKRDRLMIGLVVLAVLNTPTFAQDDYLLNQTEEVLNSEQIDIDGSFRQESEADRVAKMRKKLEKENSQMVQKKIEDIRIQQEQELAGKLKDAFQGNLQAAETYGQDQVDTVQAAPQRVVAPMPEYKDENTDGLYKVIPYVGGKIYNGDAIDSFSANVDTGVSFETMLTERFSLGFRFGYTSMDFTDSATYLNSVNNNFGEDLEIGYKNLSVGLQSKYFFTNTRFRPYIGAGAAFNKAKLELDNDVRNTNSGCYFYRGTTYCTNSLEEKDLSVSGTNFTGTASLGAEVLFNDTVGLNFEFSYTRALTTAFDANNRSSSYSDQVQNYLKANGENLDDSDIAALNIGLLVKF